mgnify:FL=1|tara:strand:+ start:382 stop:687 length:306 start_codon:yes stop_codon:yes gene_type:complete
MARPKKYNIDTDEVFKLASYGCSNVEIADFFGCDESLIRKSYSEYIRKGKASGKTRLRQLQWDSAEKGNVAMLIFLGKNILGQQDRLETAELDEPLVWSAD